MDKILKREDKLAFMALSGDNSSFSRMRGFTEFSVSKNPIEYSRRYIDEKTERNVLENIKSMTNRTIIIISHRPAALELCDKVYELHDGEVR